MGDGLYSIQMRPNYNVIVDHPNRTNNWQRFYFYVKSKNFAFEEPPGDSFRFLWSHGIGRMLLIVCRRFLCSLLMVLCLIAVEHPDTSTYPEDFVASARAVASLAQVSWKDITVERIRRVVDRISRSKFP